MKTKRKWMYILIASCIILVMLNSYLKERSEKELARSRWSFKGTILSYDQTEDGLTFTIDDIRYLEPRTMILKDDTIYAPHELEERLKNHETGIYVYIESVYHIKDFNNIYPVNHIAMDDKTEHKGSQTTTYTGAQTDSSDIEDTGIDSSQNVSEEFPEYAIQEIDLESQFSEDKEIRLVDDMKVFEERIYMVVTTYEESMGYRNNLVSCDKSGNDLQSIILQKPEAGNLLRAIIGPDGNVYAVKYEKDQTVWSCFEDGCSMVS